jgi:hypothetical protein
VDAGDDDQDGVEQCEERDVEAEEIVEDSDEKLVLMRARRLCGFCFDP